MIYTPIYSGKYTYPIGESTHTSRGFVWGFIYQIKMNILNNLNFNILI